MATAMARRLGGVARRLPGAVAAQQLRAASSAFRAMVLNEKGAQLVAEKRRAQPLEKTQVRVQVQYCSMNTTDCQAFKEEALDYPFAPGYEISGEVVEIGQSITNEQIIVGDRVAGLSLDKYGGFAEQCVLDIGDVWRIPSNVEMKQAAALVCAHSTAVYTFAKLCKLKEGNTVLVSAGAAGLGLAAIDVAANVYKAKVIAVVDSESYAELVRERGAFQTVKFSKDLKKNVLKITGKQGTDVVYDAVGEHMLDSIGSCVRAKGSIFHAAPSVKSANIPAPPPNCTLAVVSLRSLRLQKPDLYRTMVGDTLELCGDGLISPHISAKYELSKINEAVAFVEQKKCTGKVLIEIDD